MAGRIFKLLILIASLSLISCFDSKEIDQTKNVIRAFPDRSDKDVKVPKALVEILNRRFLWHYHDIKPDTELDDVQILSDIVRKYLAMDVFIVPVRNKLALPQPLHFKYPRGGGVINLKNHITGERGSFNLIMRINKEISGLDSSDLNSLKVYFSSNSRRRKIGSKKFGSGCNKLMEVTEYFNKELRGNGIKLNATDARHISVIAGTFYFALYKEGELFLASSSFEDTRWPDYQCVV